MKFAGTLFRALNPVYAREPLSGRGAAIYGGRFNRRGTPALYTSLSVVTALREANQVGSLQPTTLVSYQAEFDLIFDATDDAALAAHGMNAASLADAGWREDMRKNGEARTQAFAARLASQGYRGLLVRSFASGTEADDLNLVLWDWTDAPGCRLAVVDDEDRLARAFTPAAP